MPIGISTLCTFGKTFQTLGQYGDIFSPVIEIQDDWKDWVDGKRAKRLLEFKECHGVEYTVHTPIIDINIASANDRLRELSIRLVLKSLDHAHRIGARLAVVHPGARSPLDDYYPNTHWSHNLASLRRISSYAEDLGLDIGIENMSAHTWSFLQNTDEFKRLFDEGLPVKLTLDIGHAHTHHLVRDFIEKYRNEIAHVHIHDNMGNVDQHLVVGKGTVDWDWLGKNLSFGSINGIIESVSMNDALASLEKSRQIFKS
ncbi:MAG: sugar phosphate isomerase/epimerase [Candidatus Methanomethylicus sp.]|nr:sugar phosphate isomerase/epimerase [Candidatus Methanomethylicus sp.]